jgi:hypothetical protein
MTFPSAIEVPVVAGRDTGVLIHGRDLNAPDVMPLRMLWGIDNEDGLMGTIPAAALTMLDSPPDRLNVLTIGSGASVHDVIEGKTELEADFIKRTMVERFDELGEFKPIGEHPNWQDETARQRLAEVVADAKTDTEAQNTEDEVTNAAALFGSLGVSRVIQVTGISHGPRCLLERNRLQISGDIPKGQRWSIVTDGAPYALGYLQNSLVLEPPHRADDPKLGWPPELLPAELMSGFFNLDPEAQLLFALCARDFISKTRRSGNSDWFYEERGIARQRREDRQPPQS